MVRHSLTRLVLVLTGLTVLAACSSRSPTAPSESGNGNALTITAHPQSQTVAPGASATLNVAASGPISVSYQWYQGASGETTAPVPGAQSATYTTPALTTSTRYWVRVSASGNAVDSATATVAIAAAAPSISEQPEDVTINSGQTARLTVDATGAGPLSYQWFKHNVSNPIEGATGAAFTTPALTETSRYWVRVANAAGSVDSALATVTVASAPAPAPTPDPPAPNPTPNPPAPVPPAPAPTPTPDPSANAFEDEVLVLINQQRAAGATCGGTPYAPTTALSMNPNLRVAARDHSQDMATLNYFSHTSLDGRTFSQRMSNAGYSGGGPRGENIAAGYGSPAAVVAGWMGSTGHCQNIMNAGFRVAGVGYAVGTTSTYGTYWTMNFGGS